MLYLMRRPNESIIINNNIELKVIEVKGKAVKLGFTFPRGCSVLRKELSDTIRKENQASADVDSLLGLMSRFSSNKKD
jgi:carbon storage regulator